MTVGTAIIYAVGVTGLAVVLSLGPVEAVTVGAAAFLPAEALKIAAAGLRDHVAEAGPATHLGLVSDPDQFVLRAAAVERVVGREGRAERRGSGDAEPGTDRDIGLDRDVDVAPVQVREHVLDRADRPLLAVDRSGTGVGGDPTSSPADTLTVTPSVRVRPAPRDPAAAGRSAGCALKKAVTWPGTNAVVRCLLMADRMIGRRLTVVIRAEASGDTAGGK